MAEKLENTFANLSTSTSKSRIVVRHTKTSKLRAERGDKLQFIKNELQKLSEKQSQLSCSSKESLNSVDKFKKPKGMMSNSNSSQKFQEMKSKTAPVKEFNKKITCTTNITKPAICTTKPLYKVRPINNKLTTNTLKPDAKVTVSNCSSSRKPASNNTFLNKNSNSTTRPIFDKFKNNRLNLFSNQNNTTSSNKLKDGKFSLLPNQLKSTLSKLNDKSRRQTLMPKSFQKKAPVPPQKHEPPITNIIRKPALKTPGATKSTVMKTVTVQSPMRKSLTSMHFKRVSNCNRSSTIHRTKSWSDGLSPIGEQPMYLSPAKEQAILFRTPSMARRRSVVFQTPMSNGKKSISPFSIISTPTSSDLKRRLGLWLEKTGKPLDSFHHLRCFGIDSVKEIEEENKENFEIYIPDKNSSYENLKIEENGKNVMEESEEIFEDRSKNISIANDALYDLHKLILEKYPRDQCEAWLDLICSRFQEVQDKSQYWECRAALEEARGNYQSAIDCYSNAIEKGAEVENVNEPLDNLLEKFSVLNIGQSKARKPSKEVLDARNIFKSSIINFAIQERDKGTEDGCRFQATPVRRSTRRSRSHYVIAPNQQICSSLQNLDSSVKRSLHFQTNAGFKY